MHGKQCYLVIRFRWFLEVKPPVSDYTQYLLPKLLKDGLERKTGLVLIGLVLTSYGYYDY